MKADYEKLTKEFNSIDNDVKKWQWIANHQHLGITVMLDNDDTFAVFDDLNEDLNCLQFDSYIGNDEGVEELLSAFGIKYDGV